MAIPVFFPSRSFASKDAAKKYVRDEILRAYPLRTPIENKAHHQLLTEILELHDSADDKIGPGIDHFYVEETWRLPGKEAVGRDQRAIIVFRTDGETRDWSYRHVIESPSKATQVKSALASELEAARIRRRDEDFATGDPIYCAKTGELIPTKQQADTRHIDPSWRQLTEGFAEEHGGWDAIDTHSGHGEIHVGRGVEDTTLKDAWLDYYVRNANPVYVKND